MLRRYSLIVKATKIGIIFLAILCITIIVRYNMHNNANNIALPLTSALPTTISKSDVTVSNPIFTGNGNNTYKIHAEKISKDLGGSYYMDRITGVYNLENNQNITVTAKKCSINNFEESIELDHDVKVGYENYVLLTNKLDIDLSSKSVMSKMFVQVIGNNGSVSADKFTTAEEFNRITFDGNVKAHFNISTNK